jgi:hypothetical protein
MIEIIVNEVTKRIIDEMHKEDKKALVLFTGGKIGFESSIESIKKLIYDGWSLKVVLSKNADFVLGSNTIKQQLGIEDIFVEDEIKDINYLKQDIKKIIIPVLTMNSASKISLGISDTLITYLVSWGIMNDIPIIAAKDACDPENNIRFKSSSQVPTAYKNMIKDNLKKLESYNIKFTSAEKLYDTIVNFLKSSEPEKSQSVLLNKKLITAEDVMKLQKDNCEILVSKDTIVTALAKERANSLGIRIKIKD